jgi:hypothetical protein
LKGPFETLLPSQWFPVLFGCAWFGVIALLSTIGGWRSLAENYRVPGDFELNPAERFRFKSVQMRGHAFLPVNYGNSVTVGITARGLYLAPMILFRFMHPPLLIPWREIVDWEEGGFLWGKWVQADIRTEGPCIRLPWGIGDLARYQWRQARLPAGTV